MREKYRILGKRKIKKTTLEKLVIIFGFLCFLSFVIGIAQGYYPGYDWIADSLSDMGTFNRIFNWAMILAGLFLGAFMFTSFRLFVGAEHKLNEALLLVCAGLLAAIGIFPLHSFMAVHNTMAISFFALFPISLFILSYNLGRINIMASLFTLTCASVFIFIVICYFFANAFIDLGPAIPELLCLIVSCVWVFVFVLKYVAPFNALLHHKKYNI